MKFRNKPLTNIVITTGIASGFALIGGYLVNNISIAAFGFAPITLVLNAVMFAVSWPCVFVYRSLVMPKSVTFLEDRLLVEAMITGSKEYQFEDIVDIRSKALSNNEEKYVFTVKGGKKFQLALETYEVRKLMNLIRENDLPIKV